MFIPRSKQELEIITRIFNSSDKYWLAYQDILSEGHFSAIDGIFFFINTNLVYNFQVFEIG